LGWSPGGAGTGGACRVICSATGRVEALEAVAAWGQGRKRGARAAKEPEQWQFRVVVSISSKSFLVDLFPGKQFLPQGSLEAEQQ